MALLEKRNRWNPIQAGSLTSKRLNKELAKTYSYSPCLCYLSESVMENVLKYVSHASPYPQNTEGNASSFKETVKKEGLIYLAGTDDSEPPKLNGLVPMPGHPNQNLFCRHHSGQFVLEVFKDTKTGKVDARKFANAEDISKNVSPDIEQQFHLLREQATEIHLILTQDFGRLLEHLASRMHLDALGLLVETENHTLGVRMRHKVDDSGNRGDTVHAVSLLDPNFMPKVVRCEVRNPERLRGQTLRDYIDGEGKPHYPRRSPSPYDSYFPSGEPLVRVYVCKPIDMESAAKNRDRSDQLTICDVKLSHIVVYHLMILNCGEALVRFKNDLACLPPHLQAYVLDARNALGIPGLFMALQHGNVAAIRAYGELLNVAKLPKHILAELLFAILHDGTSGLHVALQNGHSIAIEAYGDLLIAANLAEDVLAILLSANSAHGIPGVLKALIRGQADASATYLDVLRRTKLTTKTLAVLVAVRVYDGTRELGTAELIVQFSVTEKYNNLLKELTDEEGKALALHFDFGARTYLQAFGDAHAHAIVDKLERWSPTALSFGI